MKDKLKHLPDWGLTVEPENIPAKLRKAHRWIPWSARQNKSGRVLKHPKQLNGGMAQTCNPQHRYSFEDVLAHYQAGRCNGLGFVLTGMKAKVTVLDLDKCFDDDGTAAQWAERIVDAAQSYTELSPSGKGIRIFLTGDAGEFVRPKLGVECYTQESGRYLTVTGHRLVGRDTDINPVTDELVSILDEYRPDPKDSEPGKGPVTDLSDKEIREILREVQVERYEGYDDWLRLGMAIHHQWNGDPDAMEFWDELSTHTSSYDRDELESKWDSFGLGGTKQVTVRSWFPEHEPTLHADQDWPEMDDELDGARDDSAGERLGDGEAAEDVAPEVDAYASLGLQDSDAAVDEEVPEEILEDWLAKKEVSGWAGQPGAMKTMSLLDLAVTMTKDHEDHEEYGEWLGQLVKPGVVLWFAYEGVGAIRKRLRAYRTKEPVPARLVVCTPKHDLYNQGDKGKWQEYAMAVIQAVTARHGQRPQMIVIDTLAAACPGLKEKDEEHMGTVARRLRKMAEGSRAHVAFIHHSTKDGTSDLRGSGLLGGDVDTIIKMENRGGAVAGVDIEVRKQRNLGSVGETRQGTLEIVKTGLETSFGKDETAPMLQYVERVSGQDSAQLLDLRERLRAALAPVHDGLLLRGSWMKVREEWLEEWYGGVTKDIEKKRVSEALRDIKDEFVWEPNGSGAVGLIRSIKQGQSQGIDADPENWGGF